MLQVLAIGPSSLTEWNPNPTIFYFSSWTHKQAIYENCSAIWMSKQSVRTATKFK